MTASDLQQLLRRFPDLDVLVVGDFFLDRYLIIDPDLTETSLETGLEAHQVVQIRNSPGAAGTVTSNLTALGAGRVRALGIIGADGQGHDLKAGLHATGVDTEHLIETSDRFTPTYTKPINRSTGPEMERLDIKNRTPMQKDLEDRILDTLQSLLPEVHGIIALDQVQEPNCGVLTGRITSELARLARAHPETVFFADSRTRIGEFHNVILKPNALEAIQAVDPNFQGGPDFQGQPDRGHLKSCARTFAQHTGRPVFVTLGPDGILCSDGNSFTHVPGIPVPDPIDIVGAGDSVSAGVVLALCAGAALPQAALLGVLVSSITIQQIGTTGTASPDQVLTRFSETYPEP